jgi:hypothetical protein
MLCLLVSVMVISVFSTGCKDIQENECSSHILMKNKGDKGVYNCKSCREYEVQLKEALDEPNTAEMINKLLQKEMLPYTTAKNACDNDVYSSNNNDHPIINSELALVT